MKTKIIRADFKNEWESKYGIMYNHTIEYDDKSAIYCSKKKEQTHFKAGQECEFIEETKITKNGEMTIVKPPPQGGKFSNYHKDIKREQSKYSGFAVSYVKDLIIADKIEIADWSKASRKIFKLMVELDSQDDKKPEEKKKEL